MCTLSTKEQTPPGPLEETSWRSRTSNLDIYLRGEILRYKAQWRNVSKDRSIWDLLATVLVCGIINLKVKRFIDKVSKIRQVIDSRCLLYEAQRSALSTCTWPESGNAGSEDAVHPYNIQYSNRGASPTVQSEAALLGAASCHWLVGCRANLVDTRSYCKITINVSVRRLGSFSSVRAGPVEC